MAVRTPLLKFIIGHFINCYSFNSSPIKIINTPIGNDPENDINNPKTIDTPDIIFLIITV